MPARMCPWTGQLLGRPSQERAGQLKKVSFGQAAMQAKTGVTTLNQRANYKRFA